MPRNLKKDFHKWKIKSSQFKYLTWIENENW